MFRSSQNLRLAAEMRALERVARPWREARRTWFDGTPESIEARLASTERVLTYARAGITPAHMELTREASAARSELLEAKHRLMVDFLDDGARAFRGSKRVAVSAGGDNWPDDYPLPEGSSPIDNGDGTMTCPNCGYDEVKPNTSSTCPECDHYHENFLDDSDEAVGGFERAMERKHPILPEHGGPESGLWGGKWASHIWNH